MRTRNRVPKTPFARALWRLDLTINQAEGLFKIPADTLKRWSSGRTQAPRYAWRLLAFYRLTRQRKGREVRAPRRRRT